MSLLFLSLSNPKSLRLYSYGKYSKSLRQLHGSLWSFGLYSKEGEKSEKSLEILFAMKSTIFAELPAEEYDFSYFHVLSISINFRNYVTFIEMAVSTLKVLHPWKKWNILCAMQKTKKPTSISTEKVPNQPINKNGDFPGVSRGQKTFLHYNYHKEEVTN